MAHHEGGEESERRTPNDAERVRSHKARFRQEGARNPSPVEARSACGKDQSVEALEDQGRPWSRDCRHFTLLYDVEHMDQLRRSMLAGAVSCIHLLGGTPPSRPNGTPHGFRQLLQIRHHGLSCRKDESVQTHWVT